MSKRNKIILVIAIILLVLGLVFVLYEFWYKTQKQEEQNLQKSIQEEQIITAPREFIEKPVGEYIDATDKVSPLKTLSDEQTIRDLAEQEKQAGVRAMAMFFIERFGSYSNQANYSNIEELKPFMTPSMLSWSNEFILKQQKLVPKNQEYYGVETKILSLNIKFFDETKGLVEAEANTQQIEYKGQQRNKNVNYKKAKIVLKKNNNSWLVDYLSWL